MPNLAPIPRPVLASELSDVAVAVAFAAAGLLVSNDEDDGEADFVVGEDVGVEPDSVVGVNVDEDDVEADVEAGIEVSKGVGVKPDSVAGVDFGVDNEVVIASSGADHVVAGRSDLHGILRVSMLSSKQSPVLLTQICYTLGEKVRGRRTVR